MNLAQVMQIAEATIAAFGRKEVEYSVAPQFDVIMSLSFNRTTNLKSKKRENARNEKADQFF